MAVNFGILTQQPSIGERFAMGRQEAVAEQERNALRQMQAEQIAAQREQRAALAAETRAKTERAAQRQKFLSDLGAKMAEGGYKLDRTSLGSMLQFGLQTGEDALIKLATEGLRAFDEDEREAIEMRRLGLSSPAGASAGAPAGAAPAPIGTTAPVAPTAIGTTRPEAPAPIGTAPVNALAPAVQAPAAAPVNALAGVTREQVQQMLLSPSARVRERGKALAQTIEKPYTPSADMQGYELAKLEGFKGTFFEYKRQLAEAGRPPAQPRDRTTKVELADGSIGVMNLDTGEITPATVGGQVAKGKPSAFAEKTAAQRKQLAIDLDRTINELTEATKAGGLIDQSTGSGVGRVLDVGARAFGKATAGDIAIGQLQPIADMVLKMVPRFEGPQSDKDTKSYKEAAGQLADATMPTEIRKKAALQIIRLMKDRKSQFVTPEMATEGTPAAPAAPATPTTPAAPAASAPPTLKPGGLGSGVSASRDAQAGLARIQDEFGGDLNRARAELANMRQIIAKEKRSEPRQILEGIANILEAGINARAQGAPLPTIPAGAAPAAAARGAGPTVSNW